MHDPVLDVVARERERLEELVDQTLPAERPIEPAIGNAVSNALGGIRLTQLPLRPDRLLAAIHSAKGQNR